jgi:hypothetical protein
MFIKYLKLPYCARGYWIQGVKMKRIIAYHAVATTENVERPTPLTSMPELVMPLGPRILRCEIQYENCLIDEVEKVNGDFDLLIYRLINDSFIYIPFNGSKVTVLEESVCATPFIGTSMKYWAERSRGFVFDSEIEAKNWLRRQLRECSPSEFTCKNKRYENLLIENFSPSIVNENKYSFVTRDENNYMSDFIEWVMERSLIV